MALSCGLLTAGCGGDDDSKKGKSAGRPAGGQVGLNGAVGAKRPAFVPRELQFKATTATGRPFAGTSLAGKPAVLWFWTPGCAPCVKDAAVMRKAHLKYGTTVVFVGVAGGGTSAAAKSFIAKTKSADYVQLLDRGSALRKRFVVRGQSVYIFLQRNGSLTNGPGPLTDQVLAKMVGKLAKTKA